MNMSCPLSQASINMLCTPWCAELVLLGTKLCVLVWVGGQVLLSQSLGPYHTRQSQTASVHLMLRTMSSSFPPIYTTAISRAGGLKGTLMPSYRRYLPGSQLFPPFRHRHHHGHTQQKQISALLLSPRIHQTRMHSASSMVRLRK